MPEHVVFLVHGIGGQSFTTLDGKPSHAWADPIIETFDESWRQVPKLKDEDRAKHIDLVPITYDQVFHDYLSRLASYANGLRQGLGDQLDDGTWNDILESAQDVSDEDAGFFWDSVADVLLYRFADGFAEQVHEVIREQVVAKVREYADGQQQALVKYSVLSHSLGTAAAHGALHRLGSAPIGGSDAFTAEGDAFRLHTYVALANVSRLLWLGSGNIYEKTVLRPKAPGGYVGSFINVAHRADPIARPRAFAPKDWGKRYEALSVEHLHEANVHGFAHYLKHPRVVGRLVRSLYGDRACTEAELKQLKPRDEIVAPNDSVRNEIRKVRDRIIGELDQQYGAGDDVFMPTIRTIAQVIVPLVKARRALINAGAEV
jgi:hypothetical protein